MFSPDGALRAACVLVALVACVTHTGAVSFNLEGDATKCLQEDVHKDVLVVGEYEIANLKEDQDIVLEITDSRGHPVYRKEEASKGKFAFTSDDYDVFEICFANELHDDQHPTKRVVEVSLTVKVGADAKNYDELAKVEKLKPMELELRKLEDLAVSIEKDFARMKQVEEKHRDTNESTNERMLYFSIFSMVCLTVLAIWQVLYLKRYFKQKKLI